MTGRAQNCIEVLQLPLEYIENGIHKTDVLSFALIYFTLSSNTAQKIRKLDGEIIGLCKPILKDRCFKRHDYPMCCGADEQTQKKYVNHWKIRVILDLI